MKAQKLLVIVVMLLLPDLLSAQSFRVKDYKMTVKGSSTLHEWESTVGKLDCKASFKIEGNNLADIKDATVQIPVESIKSTKGKLMDSKTYDAFNYEKYPSITFVLSSEKINASALTAELKGSLTMAGTTRPVDMTISYKLLPNGDMHITGTKKITMTEFKMEPPTAMMGTIKVGDEVTVVFDIVLSGTNKI